MKTLRFDWSRVKAYLPTDKPGVFNFRLIYICLPRDEHLVVNVWKDGYWRYIVIGTTSPRTPFIVREGGGPTKNESCWRAENVLMEIGIKAKPSLGL